MNTNPLKSFVRKTAIFLKRGSPTILTCAGAIGMVATTVLAVKATPKAIMKLNNHDNYNLYEERSKLETVKTCWRFYIPSVVTGIATLACIFGANALNKRQQASLISAYAMLNQSYKRYKAAANEVYGQDTSLKIEAQIAKQIYVSADGYSLYSPDDYKEGKEVLFYDIFSQRYFTTTLASVINAEYHLNRNLTLRGYVSINEFYDFLGVDKVDGGNEIGWDLEELLTGGFLWLDFDNRKTILDDGLECYTVSAIFEPTQIFTQI